MSFISGINAQTGEEKNISGLYEFEKAVISAVDYRSKSPVFSKTITDSVQLAAEDLFFPLPIVIFKTAELSNGNIVECVLLNNGKHYLIEDKKLVDRMSEPFPDGQQDMFDNDDFMLPPMKINESGNKIVITFDNYIYGNTAFPNQTLRGKYEITMLKK
jgi:hypothetical protein